MNVFLLTPGAVSALCQAILPLAISGYLLSRKRKSAATWWMIAMMVTATVFLIAVFLTQDIPRVFVRSALTQYVLFLWFAFFLLGFSYTFLEDAFRRERKGVLIVIGGLVVGNTLAAGYLSVRFGAQAFFVYTQQGQSWAGLVFISAMLWSIVVFLRKAAIASRDHEDEASKIDPSTSRFYRLFHPSTRSARAYRSFILVTLLLFVGGLSALMRDIGIIPQRLVSDVLHVISIAYFLGVIVVYVNYAHEPTTFQVKMVSFALALVLSVLGLVSLRMINEDDLRRAFSFAMPPPQQAVHFAPASEGGYRLTLTESVFEEERGRALSIVDGGHAVVDLGFAFPFADTSWHHAVIADDGFVSFGQELPTYTLSRLDQIVFRLSQVPRIAPLYLGLNPSAGGAIYLKREAGRVIITWHEVPHDYNAALTTLQLVLEARGEITFHYRTVPTPAALFERGIYPGRVAGAVDEVPLSAGVGQHFGRSTAVVDNYALRFSQFRHARLRGLAWTVMGASIFILLFFPVMLNASITRALTRLLEGVGRVEEGHLDTEVPIGVRDEIGYLTYNFNRMTRSLREAEAELRTYTGRLEEMVAERTTSLEQKSAALERSIRELKQTQAQLIHAEKMASLGQLTAGIAHEIKNPLNFINNFAEVNEELADELREAFAAGGNVDDLIDDLRQNAQVIARQGKRADGIVKSMMQHASGGTGQREPIDLNTLVEEYFNLAYHGMKAQMLDFTVTMEQTYDKAVGKVVMVPQEMGRVLVNLFNNAFYAVHQNAQVADEAYTPTVSVSTHRLEQAVEVRVSDNGPGIPVRVQEKIFEPFFTTKPTGSGTGLGLSLTYDIVTQGHGGTLHVESTEGEGATFVVTLPT